MRDHGPDIIIGLLVLASAALGLLWLMRIADILGRGLRP